MKTFTKTAKTFLVLSAIIGVSALSSCSNKGCTDEDAINFDEKAKKDDGTCEYEVIEEETTITVTSNITENTTWETGKTYILGGRIAVESGITLTIEPGTVIKGEAGTGANATALLIPRGAKLMAEGTAELPIIFTSVADELTPEDVAAGDYASPNLDPDLNGYWGGVIILGKAPISASSAEVQIEGIPTSDQNGLYGGTDAADNSGVLKYISIRHGGANIGEGNEINGLTLGGVGSGTVIENIEVVANQDDGIEWFGGSVDITNAIVWNAGDDAIDTDQDWTGTLDNFIVVSPLGHCFELDGPEGAASGSRHTIKNGTVVATGDDRTCEDLINTDANSNVNLIDIHFTAVADGLVINRTVDNPEVSFTGITLDVAGDLADFIEDSDVVPAGIAKGTSGKATTSSFSWTWASKAGKLSGL